MPPSFLRTRLCLDESNSGSNDPTPQKRLKSRKKKAIAGFERRQSPAGLVHKRKILSAFGREISEPVSLQGAQVPGVPTNRSLFMGWRSLAVGSPGKDERRPEQSMSGRSFSAFRYSGSRIAIPRSRYTKVVPTPRRDDLANNLKWVHLFWNRSKCS